MSNKKDRVPKAVYHQCMWIVKDMDRLRKLEAAAEVGHRDGGLMFFDDHEYIVKDSDVLAQAKWKLECIRNAIDTLPLEYRQMTIDSIIYSLPFSDMAHENTWRRWRQIFIYELAKNLRLV